jgi:hypothetical protein
VGVDATGAVAEPAAGRRVRRQLVAAEAACARVEQGEVAVVGGADALEQPPSGAFAHPLPRGERLHKVGHVGHVSAGHEI